MATPPFPTEQPRYEALRKSVDRAWQQMRAASRQLRREWFAAVGLTDPERRQYAASANAQAEGGTPRADKEQEPTPTPRPLSAKQTADLDAAIEQFLTLAAGEGRTKAAYVEAEGITQESVWLAHEVGTARGKRLAPGAPNPVFTASQRRQVMERSFERLSDEGRLRFETRLIEIRDAMIGAFNDGDSPLRIADRLGANLSGYERGRLETLVRTEMASASEQAIEGMYAAAGVEEYDLVGDPTTDAACVEAQNGGPYPIGGGGARAPIHPNCFCSQVPARRREQSSAALA